MKPVRIDLSVEGEEELKIGQRVISLHTGIEYVIKNLLDDQRILLHSEGSKGVALIHRDHLKVFYRVMSLSPPPPQDL